MESSCNQVQNEHEFVQDWKASPPLTPCLTPHGLPSLSAHAGELWICGCSGGGYGCANVHVS